VIESDISVRQVPYGSQDYLLCVALRQKILRDPLGIQLTPEEHLADREQVHLLARFRGQFAGTTVIHQVSGQPKTLFLRQVAVDEGFQGKGIGNQLIAYCEDYAIRYGFETIKLHSRVTAMPFYLKLGYQTEGEEYIEVTVPHITMFKHFS